jgi:YegS/Rv2252/BmrU family lipid kinase
MSVFRRAALLYNPASGRRSGRRGALLREAVRLFHSAGIETTVIAAENLNLLAEQARTAVAAGCDAIIACGGDGTVHGILQEITSAPDRLTLGVIPMGTGNVLARNMGLPFHPVKAAKALLRSEPKQVAIGRIAFTKNPSKPLGEERYFILNAGVGLDGMGIYQASRRHKARFGILAYYLTGFRLVATYSFPQFAVEFNGRRETVSQAGAFRVADLGPLVGRITPEASLERDDLQAILFKTKRRSRYFEHSFRSAFNMSRSVSDVELAHCRELLCAPLPDQPAREKIYAQADGEFLGGLPVRISMAQEKIALLVPAEWKLGVRKS